MISLHASSTDRDKNPRVSVMMNCFNSDRYLKEAIESVYAQTYDNWEIIFWDNASTDRSADIARSFDERVKYYRGKEFVTLGMARNLAMREASGDLIAFLDCDDLWCPSKLEKQVPCFINEEVGLVFSDCYLFTNHGDLERVYKRGKYYTGKCFSQLLGNYFLCIPTVIVRRNILRQHDIAFDEEFGFIEEADVFRRVAYHAALDMVNEPLAYARIHPDNWTSRKHDLLFDETMLMLRKYEIIIPEFRARYRQEIEQLKKQAAIIKALFYWRQGNGKDARKIIALYKFDDYKAFGLYCATYFNQKMVRGLASHFRSARISQ